MTWEWVDGNWVLWPERPIGLVHFIGGAFVGTLPQTTYGRLLETLAKAGYGIIAPPTLTGPDHHSMAQTIAQQWIATLRTLRHSLRLRKTLPVYGMGHSLGCKLHLLLSSTHSIERQGNILMSFNNFTSDRAIPFVEVFKTALPLDIIPTPSQTEAIIQSQYRVSRNLLIQFQNDDLDQTPELWSILNGKFPNLVTRKCLSGNHLTPLGQDVRWQPGKSFTPLDAFGQWIRQEVYRDMGMLEQTLLDWLDPLRLLAQGVRIT
jgi:hypothetical protein